MRAHHLVDLGEQYADLLAALDRGEALRRALALLAEGSEVAWTAHPDTGGYDDGEEFSRAAQTYPGAFRRAAGSD